MKFLPTLMLVLCAAQPALAEELPPAPEAPKRAVLVTGASAGIGRKITEKLAGEGFFVFAGARKEQDLKDLDAIPNVDSVRLDVTSPAEIAAAVETIRKSGRPLYAVVNNAGVVAIDPVLQTRDEDFDFQMQVNVYGVFRVTKAFAPLVTEAKGRIVNISSISAFLSSGGAAGYTASKAAVEGFTAALATELAPSGVAVIAVEPGAYNTDIVKKAYDRSVTKGFDGDRSKMKPPDEVAAAVHRALTDAKPKPRYMVVPSPEQAEKTIRSAIDAVVQLNEDQAYTYDRERLIKMLDEGMAKAKGR
jgi:NAD(P)-dependent dehydrogenase (short-subunit alcohol dehydrogenase family)